MYVYEYMYEYMYIQIYMHIDWPLVLFPLK